MRPNKPAPSIETTTMKKVKMRIIPFVCFLYVISYLDRVNLSYAELGMGKDLGITSEQYGIVAGIFFIGYFLFEVPSNMLLHKVGARVWIGRILVSWGIVAVIMGFAQNVISLYILRFLLGVAEAGFFPGIILYLTFWFRGKERAQAVSLFMLALPISGIIGGPVSGFILDHVHWIGLESWRWVFIIEGIPAIVFGIIAFFLLTDRPRDAKWLAPEEKEWLTSELTREHEEKTKEHQYSKKEIFMNKRIWMLAVIYFCITLGGYSLSYYSPKLISGLPNQLTDTDIGLLVAIPSFIGAFCMFLWGKHSDKTLERRNHIAVPFVICGLSVFGLEFTSNLILTVFLLTVMMSCIISMYGPFWPLPSMFLSEASAAIGIAIISSVGNLSGFFGPYLIGAITGATGSLYSGLYTILGAMVLGLILILLLYAGKKVKHHTEVNQHGGFSHKY